MLALPELTFLGVAPTIQIFLDVFLVKSVVG